MFDLKTHLNDLMIEFQHTRSERTLHKMADLIVELKNPGDIMIARNFILSNQSDCHINRNNYQNAYKI